ncbi:MAG TPA: FAD-dependent oxidoreductase, partial [Polyangiales bacterium]
MQKRVIVIGGGLAGLSAGCYARMCGFEVRVLEHAAQAGGMCTSWSRAPYSIDGCIHWLAGAGEGGAFRPVYEELGISRDVVFTPLTQFQRFEDPVAGWEIEVGADLAVLRSWLETLAPQDQSAIAQLFQAVERCAELKVPLAPHELASFTDAMRQLWDARKLAPTFLRMHGTLASWAEHTFTSPALRSLFSSMMVPQMPAWLLPMMLHMLGSGQLSRPVGGSAMVRDAVVRRLHELGGELTLQCTVDEILVRDSRACGVRLQDGTELDADAVICTASAHETHLRLLGGRYLDRDTRERLDHWRTFDPIVMVNVGVATPLRDEPSTVIVRQAEPLVVGGRP